MQTKHKEQLHTQENVNVNHNSTSLVEYEKLKGTPFTIVTKDKKHFLVMGNYALTEQFDNKEDIHEYIKDNMWLLITTINSIICEAQLKELDRLVKTEQLHNTTKELQTKLEFDN